jgi:hypothetical protein
LTDGEEFHDVHCFTSTRVVTPANSASAKSAGFITGKTKEKRIDNCPAHKDLSGRAALVLQRPAAPLQCGRGKGLVATRAGVF